MACFKNLRTTALLATTLLGSISFVHGMKAADDEVTTKYTKLSFNGINVDDNRDVYIKEENGNFHKLTVEEAKEAINTLSICYGTLSVDDKIPFIKLGKYENGSIVFKQKLDETSFRLLPPEDANTKLQAMLLACGNAGLITTPQLDAEGATTDEEDSDQLQLQRLRENSDEDISLQAARLAAVSLQENEQETARIQAETLRIKQEAEEMRAELARQQQAQAAELLRLQQEELASIKAQLLAQAEALKQQQAAAAQAEAHRREQEAALQAQLAAQAEALRLQQEAAAQAQLAAQAEEQQKLAILGNRTPERVEKNINREIKKGKKHLKKLGF